MNVRRLAHDGVVLLGHVIQGDEGKLCLTPDLRATLICGDEWSGQFTRAVDEHVRQNGLDAPEDDRMREIPPDPQEVSSPILELDLRDVGITSVV
jgi:putative flavoprotein involved in K+ transport